MCTAEEPFVQQFPFPLISVNNADPASVAVEIGRKAQSKSEHENPLTDKIRNHVQ